MHRETVNWGFLSKTFFLSRHFHLFLLAVHIGSIGYMAFCCFPTLFKKINSELVAIRFGGKRRKSEQQSEKKGGIREDNKEIAENPTFVQLVSLVGNKERAMKESSEKADDLDECKLSWQLWLACLGVVALLVLASLALPPLHPVLLHTLFWPSLA